MGTVQLFPVNMNEFNSIAFPNSNPEFDIVFSVKLQMNINPKSLLLHSKEGKLCFLRAAVVKIDVFLLLIFVATNV